MALRVHGPVVRTFLGFAGAGIVLLTHGVLPRMLGNWHATDSEQNMRVPGDDLITSPGSQNTMVVTIDASAKEVWPWIVQMGIDRAGFYSWLWVENGLMRLGAANADRIHPEWQELEVGDMMAFMPESYPGGRRGPLVKAIDPERSLVLDTSQGAPIGTIFGTWQFLLIETANNSVRLLLRARANRQRPVGLKIMDFALQPGYLLMSRAMLLGIKQRVERQTGNRRESTSSPSR